MLEIDDLSWVGQLDGADVLEHLFALRELGAEQGSHCALSIALREGDVEVARLPRAGRVQIAVPDESFLGRNWSV